MRLALIGAALLLVGGVAVATGMLPVADIEALAERVLPILAFVLAMTVATELMAEAGLFTWIARRLRHWGRGRSVVLWLFVALVAVLSTVFLSLDTTAVLLTPIVVTVARQAGLPPLPFALTTVWLANTASLLLARPADEDERDHLLARIRPLRPRRRPGDRGAVGVRARRDRNLRPPRHRHSFAPTPGGILSGPPSGSPRDQHRRHRRDRPQRRHRARRWHR